MAYAPKARSYKRHQRRKVAYLVQQPLRSELAETGGDLEFVSQKYSRSWILSLRPFFSEGEDFDFTIEGERHQLIVIGRTELQIQRLH